MKSAIVTLLAVAMIGLGGWRHFNSSFVSSEDHARCEDAIQAQYPDNPDVAATLIEECSEPGMAAMMIHPTQELEPPANPERFTVPHFEVSVEQ